jgi:hypothetical protein
MASGEVVTDPGELEAYKKAVAGAKPAGEVVTDRDELARYNALIHKPLTASNPASQEFRKEEPWWSRAIPGTLETVGALGLGAAGAVAGPEGAIAGGTAGYSAGKLTGNKIRELLGWKKPPQTATEVLSDTANAITEGALMELTGVAAGKVAGYAVKEATPELQHIRDIFKKYNIKPLPSEIAPSKTKGILESVLSYTPASGDVFYKRAMARIERNDQIMEDLIAKKAPQDTIGSVGSLIKTDARRLLERYSGKKTAEIEGMVDDITSRVGASSKYTAGSTFEQIMKNNRAGRRLEINDLEAELQAALPMKGDDMVTISPETEQILSKIRKDELAKTENHRDKDLLKTLSAYLPNRGKAVSHTWAGMRGDKTSLQEMSSSIKTREMHGTTASRNRDVVSEAIDDDMRRYAQSKGGQIWAKYDAARTATRKMYELYDKDTLKIMNLKPEAVLDRIIGGGEKGITELKRIKDAVGEEGLIPLRQGFITKQLDSSMDKGVLSPDKLARNMAKVADNVKAELLTADQRELMRRLIDRGKDVNEKVGRHAVTFLETIAGENNGSIVEALIKPENSYNIRLLKRFFSPQKVDQITSTFLENTVFKRGGAGNFLPTSSNKEFMRYKPVLGKLLPAERIKDLSEFMSLGRYSESVEKLARNASQTGQVLVGHGIIGQYLKAVAQFATGQWKSAAGTAGRTTGELFLGKMLAKIYTSDLAAKYFTGALHLAPQDPRAVAMFVKALGIAGLTGIEQANEQKPGQPPTPRADGGPVTPGQPYLVGEQGPETMVNAAGATPVGVGGPQIVNPSQPGNIIPNGQNVSPGAAQSTAGALPSPTPQAPKPELNGWPESGDYDYQAYVEKYGPLPKFGQGHLSDWGKKPNHMTFSTDSKYSKEGMKGGGWKEINGLWHFRPSEYNLSQHTPQEYFKYFQDAAKREGVEKAGVLDLPPRHVLMPAIRADGKTYTGSAGEPHANLQVTKGAKSAERGFTTPDGQFLTRQQAKDYLKENMPQVYAAWKRIADEGEESELHVRDLSKAIRKVENKEQMKRAKDDDNQ